MASRPFALSVYWNCWSGGAGGWPIAPAATCWFCSRSTAITSCALIPSFAELVGIQPDAHRVAALAELRHLAHTRQAPQAIGHVDAGVVAEEELIAGIVGGDQVHDQREVGGLLGDGDAAALYVFGELRLRDLDAVLHVDGRC